MTKKFTKRQEGIIALRDLLLDHNVVFVGDEGMNRSYDNFMKDEGIPPKQSTKQQQKYEKQLRRLGD